MAYGDFKDLPRRTDFDKVLCVKSFNIARNQKNDVYQRGLASMVYKFLDKESSDMQHKSASSSAVKKKIMSNWQIAEELIETSY